MSFLENATPVSPQEAAFNLLSTLLKSSIATTSRTVRTSSNGVVYTQVGNLINSASVLATNKAWFVLQGRAFWETPGSSVPSYREFCFQTDGSGGLRIKYSPRAGFYSGTPSATQVPAASDEKVLFGGGTDSSPTFTSFFPASGYRQQGYASEADDQFWFLTYPVGGDVPSSMFFLDIPSDASPTDRDPAVIYIDSTVNCALDTHLCSETYGPMSVLLYGESASLWARVPMTASYVKDTSGTNQRVFPAGVSTSPSWPTPSYYEETPRYARRAAVSGTTLPGEVGNNTTTDVKGYSGQFKWSSLRYGTPTLLNAVDATSGVITTGGILAVGHLLLPWSGTLLSV